MKVRYGFVSNSSSTSFCIFGTSIEPEKIDKAYQKKFGPNPPLEDDDPYAEDLWIDTDEELNNLLKNSGLSYVESIEYSDTYYVGIDVGDLDYDKTLLEQKKEIQDKIKEVFNFDDYDTHIVSFVVEGGYDN